MEAEQEVAITQSYNIGTRSLTRANLAEIGSRIKFWRDEIAKLEQAASCRGRNRMYRVIPRDI